MTPVASPRYEASRLTLPGRAPAAAFELLGDSPPMVRLRSQVDAVAWSDAAVLVTGESGTGKELVARRLHARSARRDRPFVAINCAAFPESLLEAELFGHERGAFTGAHRQRVGRFQAAHTGILFLDEVGELSPGAQAKLLRVLQTGTFEPLGTSRPCRVDVRVISATHRDLPTLIREGKFREDLYYRLKVVHVRVPALRERREDLPVLVEHFLRKLAPGQPHGLTVGAWAALREHSYPGNVRELENAIHHAVVVSNGLPIRGEHLPVELIGDQRVATAACEAQAKETVPTLADATRAFEREFLIRTLRSVRGARTIAAERLGISRKNLWEKLRRHGITEDELSGERSR